MNRRGFTIVELLIVLTIMGILLTLGVANLRGTQVNARDSERKTDVETIALHLETYYQSGSDTVSSPGDYPSTVLTTSGTPYIQQVLRDIDINSLMAPGITDPAQTFIKATNTTQTTAGVLPQPTVDQYVYQPLQLNGSTWSLCTLEAQECRKFNIYYRLEADNSIQLVTSKNQ